MVRDALRRAALLTMRPEEFRVSDTVVLRRRHHPGAVAVLHAHPIGFRERIDPRDNRLRHGAASQQRPTALAAWSAEALMDRMNADLRKLAAHVVAGGGDVLPIGFVGDVALLAIGGAGVCE